MSSLSGSTRSKLYARVHLSSWSASSLSVFRPTRLACLSLSIGLLLVGLLLASCDSGGGNTPGAQSTPASTALSKLRWCDKPMIVFRDLGATGSQKSATPTTTPTTLNDWSQVKPALGFTVYLPATLEAGTCLMSASGTLHDPIFGSSFTIGYLLPDHSSISLSQAPLRSQQTVFQCSPAANTGSSTNGGVSSPTTTNDVQLCSGARGTTNIVFSAHGKPAALQQFFNALQSNVEWVPGN